jgi:acyl-[acyl-carrier-protein]-phospholipid O-acyltransferase/long-chain-fatty-acid--[acyl-carrier-protein] ligase
MSQTQFYLLRSRRFAPLFVTQFLGAMNDNLFKQSLVILITFRLAQQTGLDGQILVTVAAGVFIVPFFLFSATAGQLADKFEKARSIRLIKIFEILIMGLAAGAFYLNDSYVLLGVLFLMGTQSAFFGPLKYGILPSHLRDHELIGGNALIEGATFLAILIGTIAGGLVILTEAGAGIISISIVAFAVLGWIASTFIPRAEAPAPELKLNPNLIGETWNIVRLASKRRSVFLSILGISWFWLVGATFLSQFPNFTREVLGADETVVTLFMVVFSIGIAIGSLWCNRLLDGEISARYVPFGALGLTLFTLDLYFATEGLRPPTGTLTDAAAFVGQAANWRILADLVLIAICGGLYTVPLYAILQHDSEETERARIIAGNNILNALFMVVGAVAATAMLAADMSVSDVFLVVAIVNAFVAVYIVRLLPEAVVKAILVWILKLFYRVEVRGLDHYEKIGDRAVIVVNHVSFLDGLLLAAFLPKKPIFAIDTFVAQSWWFKPFMALAEAFPMDPTNPMATKALIKKVRENRHCVIFPEGRITVTGALMKIYEGPGLIADKSDAPLIPIRIDGAQYTHFSRLRGKLRQRWFPKITLTILPPQSFDIPPEIVGRARRQMAAVKLYDVMTNMIFATCDCRQTLFAALLDARSVHGGKPPMVEDVDRKPIGYSQLILRSLIVGRRLARITGSGEFVGVMLPNSVAAVVAFFGLQAYGRVPAMLNFSTGTRNMVAALAAAQIKTVLTSRRFVDFAKMAETIEELSKHAGIVYLEDIRDEISVADKLAGIIGRLWPRRFAGKPGAEPDDPAVVLFTSGSEGTPKGVVLSHANLLANRYQLGARIDFNPTDVVFNALPIFHSFGLLGGMLLPILSGIRTFLYPSPLHYRIVPALVYDTNATIMFGTDTFLAGYGRAAHPYDFYSVRYIFAGAEKVKRETRRQWDEKFGIRVLEGYGTTETSPVLAVNTPMHYRPGTVGRFLPGIDYRLEPVPGIDHGARLFVSGPNVMLGYLRAENPGVVEPPAGGSYDTGDIVDVDEFGFVTILGRVKRFAKIAGEMVSLAAVEGCAAALWSGHIHAVVSISDARAGERLVLVTECSEANRDALLAYSRANGIAEIMIPKTIHVVDRVPILGTGKIDYVAVAAMVEQAAG